MSFFLQQTINGIIVGSGFALYASGFSLVMANLRVFHIAHAGVFTWAAIGAYEAVVKWHISFWLALPVVAVLAGLLDVLCYLLLIRHLDGRRDRELAAFVSTLGGFILLTQLAVVHLNDQAVSLPVDNPKVHTWHAGGIQVSSIQLLIFCATVLSFALLYWLVKRTQLGREMKAVAFDTRTSKLLGVSVDRTNAAIFFISGALAGISASLIAVAYRVINAQVGSTYLILAIAVMVLGGFGNVLGVAVGGLLVGLCSSYTVAYVSSGAQDLVVFALLFIVLLIRPQGLFRVPSSDGKV